MIWNDGVIKLDIVLKTMAKNKIYIFGAGASKEFGYPLGNEFSHYAFRVKEFENLAHSEYAQHVKHLLPKITNFLNILYPNLPIKIKRGQANYAKHPQMGSGLDMGHFCGDLVDDFPSKKLLHIQCVTLLPWLHTSSGSYHCKMSRVKTRPRFSYLPLSKE